MAPRRDEATRGERATRRRGATAAARVCALNARARHARSSLFFGSFTARVRRATACEGGRPDAMTRARARERPPLADSRWFRSAFSRRWSPPRPLALDFDGSPSLGSWAVGGAPTSGHFPMWSTIRNTLSLERDRICFMKKNQDPARRAHDQLAHGGGCARRSVVLKRRWCVVLVFAMAFAVMIGIRICGVGWVVVGVLKSAV